ncbi:MAG: DUF5838 family protein [Cyanobacteria bacterium J06633_8]
MIITQLKKDRLKEQRLQFLRSHQEAFDVESTHTLPLFEEFVMAVEGDCTIEPSCKVEEDKLIASRFNLFFRNKSQEWEKYLNKSLTFIRQVETRVGTQINYSLLGQFLGHNFDFSKVKEISAGIDLRGDLAESSLKIAIIIEDYPEKLETAFFLCDCIEKKDYLNNSVRHIGFDFYLDGRSEIELYASISEKDFSKPQSQHLVQRYFPKSLNPLEISKAFVIGLSKANSSPVIYYSLDKKKILSYFNLNDTAQRVHNFYQHQEIRPEVWVGVTKEELEKTRIDNIRLYYHKPFFADE